MARDPVCGMEVDERKAEATAQFQGRTFHFCSMDCKKEFDQNPEQFTRAA
jgi:YHS domain-containing protein